MIRNIIKKIKLKLTKKKWQDIEYFDIAWKNRIRAMASLIKGEKSVLDLGCGEMWLKESLDSDVKYYPVDYVSRSKDVIVCDFNKKEFPQIEVDVVFVSGCLEYVRDVDWFLDCISKATNVLILSYCALENVPNKERRKKNCWVNDMKLEELKQKIVKRGYTLSDEIGPLQNNNIMRFDK